MKTSIFGEILQKLTLCKIRQLPSNQIWQALGCIKKTFSTFVETTFNRSVCFYVLRRLEEPTRTLMHVLQNLPTKLMRTPQKRLWIQSLKRQSFKQNLFVQWDEPRILPWFPPYFFSRTIRVKEWQHMSHSSVPTYTSVITVVLSNHILQCKTEQMIYLQSRICMFCVKANDLL